MDSTFSSASDCSRVRSEKMAVSRVVMAEGLASCRSSGQTRWLNSRVTRDGRDVAAADRPDCCTAGNARVGKESEFDVIQDLRAADVTVRSRSLVIC
jgi:hypothetical protein